MSVRDCERQKVNVSIVIPARNRASEVRRSIEAIRNLPDVYELIVVDDASSPSLQFVELTEAMNRPDVPVRLISNSHCLGAQRSRLIGLAAALGEYVCFCDSDDEILREGWDAALEVLAAASPPDLIFGDVLYERRERVRRVSTPILRGRHFAYILQHLSLCPFSGLIVRRGAVEPDKVSCDLPSWQDDDFVLSVARNGVVFHTHTVHAKMHFSPEGISASFCRLAAGLRQLLQKYGKEIYQEHGARQLLAWQMRHLELRLQCRYQTRHLDRKNADGIEIVLMKAHGFFVFCALKALKLASRAHFDYRFV